MSNEARLAIAAHLHVLLRRKAGRITDPEWMAVNRDYAREIVRVARSHAAEGDHADLADWAARLERSLEQPELVRVPIEKRIRDVLGEEPLGASIAAPPTAGAPERYVGRLR